MKYSTSISLSVKGFTLIELLVSISIVSIITAVIIFNYGQFNNNLVITNLAYQIALEVRQAQIYGLSVRANGTGASATFNSGYGVHFEKSDPSSFWFFVDTNGDGLMPSTDVGCAIGSECLEKITLQGNNRVEKFCAATGVSDTCLVTPNQLDISFKRPDPDAKVIDTFSSGSPTGNKNAKIYLLSTDGKEKVIYIDQSGQISIK